MGIFDVDELLRGISAEGPCGENLEYDPAFAALERSVQGTPEQQLGETVIPAEKPNWRAVKEQAPKLFARTKDLRVAVYLIRGLVNTDGFPGLAEGLALLRGLLDRWWIEVHPRLDPDDDNDPTLRMNTVASLGDRPTMLRDLREAPLIRSRVHGQFALRDVDIATSKQPAPTDREIVSAATIETAFLDCEVEDLQATAAAIERSIACVKHIESLLAERVGAAHSPDLSALSKELHSAHRMMSERLTRRGVAGVTGAAGDQPSPGTGIAAAPLNGINSRGDVIRMLDLVSDYLGRNEPTNPAPLLIDCAKRLMSKSFVEIMRDMGPDGVALIEKIRGTPDK